MRITRARRVRRSAAARGDVGPAPGLSCAARRGDARRAMLRRRRAI